jgi:hypothetical protein
MRAYAMFVLIFLFGSLVYGEGLSIQLEIAPAEVIVGVPFLVKLTLTSNTDFALHGGLGFCDSEHTKINVKDSSGNPTAIAAFDCEGSTVERNLFDSDAKKTYGSIVSTQDEMYLPAGSYRISAEYRSSGPYVDRYSDTDIRPVEGIWIGELTSNEVKVTVKNPEGEDQVAFQALRPSQEELQSPENKISWFLKLKGEQLRKDYPKSNYAAWVQWKLGKIWFDEYGGSDSSVKEDFEYQDFMNEVDRAEPIAGANIYREKIQKIIELWSPLYKDFPEFVYRPVVLHGLAQAYIRNGEYPKAQPLIKELLERHSKSPEATKAIEYKKTLIEKGLWQE